MKRKRKSKPLRTKRGEYFRYVEQQILEWEIKLGNIKIEQNNLLASCQKRGVVRGVTYDNEKVKSSSNQLTFMDAMKKISALQPELEGCIFRIEELKKEKTNLIDMYESSEEVEDKVFFYREIKGWTQERTAEEMGYSVRHIQRIENNLISE